MISPKEIFKYSKYSGREDLTKEVYQEYLLSLLAKYISEINLKYPFYHFGSYFNRIVFDINRFGNCIEFLTKNKSIADYNYANSFLCKRLELEGFNVKVTKITKYKYCFDISSYRIDKDISGYSYGESMTIKLFLNYYFADKYFTGAVFKKLIKTFHLNSYDINTKLFSVKPELSLTILLRIIYINKKIELIELFDVYKLIKEHNLKCEQSIFKKNEFKNIKKRIIEARKKIPKRILKETTSDNFKVVDEISLNSFHNFKTWISEIDF